MQDPVHRLNSATRYIELRAEPLPSPSRRSGRDPSGSRTPCVTRARGPPRRHRERSLATAPTEDGAPASASRARRDSRTHPLWISPPPARCLATRAPRPCSSSSSSSRFSSSSACSTLRVGGARAPSFPGEDALGDGDAPRYSQRLQEAAGSGRTRGARSRRRVLWRARDGCSGGDARDDEGIFTPPRTPPAAAAIGSQGGRRPGPRARGASAGRILATGGHRRHCATADQPVPRRPADGFARFASRTTSCHTRRPRP